jgi:osmotically inducible lipoprotein OsmB
MRKPAVLAATLVVTALILTGCGTRPSERALSGGALGAAAGAGVAAIAGGSLAAGAVVGGLGGALVGAVTSPNQVNLDRPRRRR